MAKFEFSLLVNDPMAVIQSTGLLDGTGAIARLTMNDVGKLVAFERSDNYRLANAGEGISGFVSSLSPTTVNNGVSFGSIQRSGRFFAILETAGSVGDSVIAGTGQTVGLPMTSKHPMVAVGTSPNGQVWKILAGFGTTGTQPVLPPGTRVLVESA